MSEKWMRNGAPRGRILFASLRISWNAFTVVNAPSEVAHATHHLDAEVDVTALALEALAQLGELLDDGRNRVLSRAPEQEARVEDDDLGATGDGDAG